MKRIFEIALVLLVLTMDVFPQWNMLWSSPAISGSAVAGWLNYEKTGATWNSRIYLIDSLKFQIMQDGFSLTPQYTYTFDAGERLAGGQMYSLNQDLTGDNITEFYVLSYNGTSLDYRISFKIINITNNSVVFEKNATNYSYSYPTLYDVNNDNLLEFLAVKSDYPYTGLNYYYEVYATGIPAGVNQQNKPVKFELKQNYPNPFNPSTSIEYSVSAPSNVKLEIYDIKGELVKSLLNTFQNSGSYKINWNGSTLYNSRAASGIYFYTLSIGERVESRKMILLK